MSEPNEPFKRILLCFYFLLFPLILLVLNDHVLKHSRFAGFATGKLSDFAGLMVFAISWLLVFRPQKKSGTVTSLLTITAIFLFFKCTESGCALAERLLGKVGIISHFWPDVTDACALAILPLALMGYRKLFQNGIGVGKAKSLKYAFVFASTIACLFTSTGSSANLPVVSDCNLGISNKTSSSVQLSWQKATGTNSHMYLYRAYYATNSKMDSVDEIKANGTLGVDWSTDINTANISNLSSLTIYYFNVLVKEAGSDEVAYCKNQTTTL